MLNMSKNQILPESIWIFLNLLQVGEGSDRPERVVTGRRGWRRVSEGGNCITRYRNTLTDVLSSVRVFWVTLTDVLGIYPDGLNKKPRPHGRFFIFP